MDVATLIGLMVGIDTKDNKLIGIGVTTHAETPGMGEKAKSDPSFAAQYKGKSIEKPITVNAIRGATITSVEVSKAATEAGEIYKKMKSQIDEKLPGFKK